MVGTGPLEVKAGGETPSCEAEPGYWSAVGSEQVEATANDEALAAGSGTESAVGNEPVGAAAVGETPSHAVELGFKSAVGTEPVEAGRGVKSAESV